MYIRPNWREGEEKKYEVIKTTRIKHEGKTTENTTLIQELSVKISEINAKGYIVHVEIIPPKSALSIDAHLVNNSLRKMVIRYEIDKNGLIKEQSNGHRLQKAYNEMREQALSKYLKLMEDAIISPSLAVQSFSKVTSAAALKEHIDVLCARELSLFFILMGKVFHSNTPYMYETYQNPVLESPIKVDRGIIRLKRFEEPFKNAIFQLRQSVSTEDTNHTITELLKKILKKKGLDKHFREIYSTLLIEDTAYISVDQFSGWPLNLTHTTFMKETFWQLENSMIIRRKSKNRISPSIKDIKKRKSNRFHITKMGFLKDHLTGLEWYKGMGRKVRWLDAKAWVQSIDIDGGGWHLPTLGELRTLYNAREDKDFLSVIDIKAYGKMWSDELSGFSKVWTFDFDSGSNDAIQMSIGGIQNLNLTKVCPLALAVRRR